jgi:thioredoxin-like negative regulator of GroEL
MGAAPKTGASKSGGFIGAGSEEALRKRLEQIAVQMTELVFRMNTNAISMPQANAELAALKAEFSVLQKQNEALKAQAPINITVNGAIDKEGTARSIVDVLNNSFYRGGGGGANALVTP